MKFAWDPEKAKTNLHKHGIAFEALPAVFQAPMLIEADRRLEYGETRWRALGILGGSIVHLVYTQRNTVYRIISARKATRHEREIFFKSL